jgi:hypothetical protein
MRIKKLLANQIAKHKKTKDEGQEIQPHKPNYPRHQCMGQTPIYILESKRGFILPAPNVFKQ